MSTLVPRRVVFLLVVPVLALAAVLASVSSPAQSATASPIYGVTIDRIGHIASIVSAERTLPNRPTTRVYFNVSEPASYYRPAVLKLDGVSSIMGELLDSSEATQISTTAYQIRVESYLSSLQTAVDIWEVGNEVNGNWTGAYASGSAKLEAAYRDVAAAGAKTALTLYANEFGSNNCGDGVSELTPVQYSAQYVPQYVRDGLSYVFESYYPTQCQNTYPTSAQVASEMQQLHALYPGALLGFGETGLPRPGTRRTLGTANQVMSWAYSLNPALPYYVGGYFWWYARQDAFVGRKLLARSLVTAFQAEARVFQ